MKLSLHRSRLGATWLALSLSLFVGTAAAAQPADIPRLANGKPDFSGIWETTSAAEYDLEPHAGRRDAPPFAGAIDGDGRIPYLPAALEKKKRNFDQRATLDPRLKCFTPGVPRSVLLREPFQIFQRPRDLVLLHQFGHTVRTIHTNGTEHPDRDEDYWLGDSRGRWDGDTLVVDIIDFYDETWLDRAGNFHSTDLHVVERWKLLDRDTIEYRATLEDRQVFSRPWTLSVLLHRHREKNFQIIEDYCFTLPYESYYPPRRPEASK